MNFLWLTALEYSGTSTTGEIIWWPINRPFEPIVKQSRISYQVGFTVGWIASLSEVSCRAPAHIGSCYANWLREYWLLHSLSGPHFVLQSFNGPDQFAAPVLPRQLSARCRFRF